VIALALMPRRTEIASSARLPAWDIPARMIVATAFVLALTAAAPALGAHLTGLLAPFPVYAAVLTVFAHRLQGSTSARGVLRGLLLGLFAFVGFFAVLAALLGRIGLAVAFGAATAVALGCQGVSLVLIRRRAVT
jgi:O-antigen/teichoic acid export membrane protein